MSILDEPKKITAIVCAVVALIVLGQIPYIVDEGHVGIVKKFGEAVSAENPGLHFKVPFVHKIEEVEVRTRKSSEKMNSSTSEQMPITITSSINWTVNKEAALDMYKQYGGLMQFEDRILDPRFRAVVKDVMPEYTAEKMIQDRSAAQVKIEEAIVADLAAFPIVVGDVQIENIILPIKYINSIETKQTEKNLAAAEEHKLARQALTAEQAVNTAKAERDAAMAKADGAAYAVREAAKAEAEAITVKGVAEASAIKAKSTALKNNPLIVKLTEAQRWNGKLPVTMMGEGIMPIMDIRQK